MEGVTIIKERRSIYEIIFGKQNTNNKSNGLTNVQLLNTYQNQIYSFSGDLYNDDTYRGVIDCIARNFAKMEMQHRLNGNKVSRGNINKLLGNPTKSFNDTI